MLRLIIQQLYQRKWMERSFRYCWCICFVLERLVKCEVRQPHPPEQNPASGYAVLGIRRASGQTDSGAICAPIYVLYLFVRGLGSSSSARAGVTQGPHWLTRSISRLPWAERASLVQADSPEAGGQAISATHEVLSGVVILEVTGSRKLACLLQAPSHVPLVVVMVQTAVMQTRQFFIDPLCRVGTGYKTGYRFYFLLFFFFLFN